MGGSYSVKVVCVAIESFLSVCILCFVLLRCRCGLQPDFPCTDEDLWLNDKTSPRFSSRPQWAVGQTNWLLSDQRRVQCIRGGHRRRQALLWSVRVLYLYSWHFHFYAHRSSSFSLSLPTSPSHGACMYVRVCMCVCVSVKTHPQTAGFPSRVCVGAVHILHSIPNLWMVMYLSL